MSNYIYLIFILIGAGLIAYYVYIKLNELGVTIRNLSIDNASKLSNRFQSFIGELFTEDSKVRGFYTDVLLKYSKTTFEKLVELKIIIFVISLSFMLLYFYTNIGILSNKIFTSFVYKVDLMYEYNGTTDKQKALDQEVKYLKKAMDEIGRKVYSIAAEDAQMLIKAMINEQDYELSEPKDTLANKVYHRLVDYYEIRKINFLPYLLLSMLFTFIPEFIFAVRNRFAVASRKKELRYLKKLIILNGSIPPVDYLEVIELLISRAKYYKAILEDIKDGNQSNSVSNTKIYSKLISNTKNLEEKLFFESLDDANNSNFSQAVKNIAYEFEIEKKEAARNVKNQVKNIEICGSIGFSIILLIIFIKVVLPWLNMYDMSQFNF